MQIISYFLFLRLALPFMFNSGKAQAMRDCQGDSRGVFLWEDPDQDF